MCRDLFLKITYVFGVESEGCFEKGGHACLKKTKASEKYENIITI